MSSETESLYWRDLPAWTDEQAAALRALKLRRDLPNTLDLDNLIEEVEALGRSELKATTSPIRLILEHLIKLACVPDATAANHWRAEIRNRAVDVRKSFAPSIRQKIDLDELWRDALDIAPDRLADFGVALPDLPAACPITLDDLLADPFDVEAAVARIAQPASPGA